MSPDNCICDAGWRRSNNNVTCERDLNGQIKLESNGVRITVIVLSSIGLIVMIVACTGSIIILVRRSRQRKHYKDVAVSIPVQEITPKAHNIFEDSDNVT